MPFALWLPGFGFAYAISLLAPLLFVIWLFLDCSFPQTASLVGQDLRLRFLFDPGVRYEHRWDNHGPRVLVFFVLMSVSVAATLTTVLQLLLWPDGERSLIAMLLVAGLAAVWAAIFAGYRRLCWRAFCRRVFRFQGVMEAAVPVLLQQWPEKEITLVGLGTYTVSDRKPNLLFREGPRHFRGFHETVGERIGRNQDGDLCFDVGSDLLWWVQYRRDGRTRPESCEKYDPPYIVTQHREYETEYLPGWHLVRVGFTFQRKDEEDPKITAEIAARPPSMRLPHQHGRFRVCADVEVDVMIWSYQPYIPYTVYDHTPVGPRRRRKRVTIGFTDVRRSLLRKGEVLHLDYEPDASQTTGCYLTPENYEDMEPYLVAAEDRQDRDYYGFSIIMPYTQLDKDFEWLDAGGEKSAVESRG